MNKKEYEDKDDTDSFKNFLDRSPTISPIKPSVPSATNEIENANETFEPTGFALDLSKITEKSEGFESQNNSVSILSKSSEIDPNMSFLSDAGQMYPYTTSNN